MVFMSKAETANGILARVEQASTWLKGRRVKFTDRRNVRA